MNWLLVGLECRQNQICQSGPTKPDHQNTHVYHVLGSATRELKVCARQCPRMGTRKMRTAKQKERKLDKGTPTSANGGRYLPGTHEGSNPILAVTGPLLVLSDECEPVFAMTRKLPFMPFPTDATQRERQRG